VNPSLRGMGGTKDLPVWVLLERPRQEVDRAGRPEVGETQSLERKLSRVWEIYQYVHVMALFRMGRL